MRRGLISWSSIELPESALDHRVAQTRAAMTEAGIDAMLVYTTPARTAGVSWLTGFVPYWNQGLLVVPRAGPVVLVSALSNRVKGWIQRNAHVTEVRSSPQFAVEAAAAVTAAYAKAKVAIVDMPQLPGVIARAVADAGHNPIDGTDIFATLRTDADPAELQLAYRAAHIAHRALAAISPGQTDAGAAVAAMEGEARRLGAEEVYPAVAVDLAASTRLVRLEGAARLGPVSAIRASVAYKGVWVRMTRTLASDASTSTSIDDATAQFAAAAAALPRTDALASFKSWLVEGCRTTMPLEPLAGSIVDDPLPLAGSALISIQATIELETGPVLLGAPALMSRTGAPASLLCTPTF